MSSTLEASELMISRIVARLAEQGVARRDLKVVELEYEPTRENALLFIDAMKWLHDEGVVRLSEGHAFTQDGTAQRVCLTSYGYALLAQRFDGSMTLAVAIQKTNASGSGFSGLGDLVGGILGGFTKSISS